MRMNDGNDEKALGKWCACKPFPHERPELFQHLFEETTRVRMAVLTGSIDVKLELINVNHKGHDIGFGRVVLRSIS